MIRLKQMRSLCAIATMAMILALLSAPLAHAQQPLVVVDYETGTADSGYTGVETTGATAPDAVFVSTQYARSGLYSVGHKVTLGDPAYVSYGAPRSEMTLGALPIARYTNGDHRAYAFSVLLNDWQDWTGGTATIDIIWQFKHVNGGPDMFVGIRRNQMLLRYGNDQIVLIDDIRPYDNQWIDLRFEVLWSSNPDGYFTADVRLPGAADFVRKANVSNHATFDPASAGAHGVVQWGLYRPDSTIANGAAPTRIIYHDDIAVTALPSPSIRLQKAFGRGGRFGAGDQFGLAIESVATGRRISGDTTGTVARVNSAPVAMVTPTPGTYVLSEVPALSAPTTNLANYQTRYACTNNNPGGPAPQGTGTTFSVTVSAQDELECVFTNTRNTATDLAVFMTNTPAAGNSDQADDTVTRGATSTYRIVVANNGPDTSTGAILRSSALAGLNCTSPASCVGTACPNASVPIEALNSSAGVALGTMAMGESISLSLDCMVQ
ncbi:heparin lyase I family protein [Lysobacter gummosus]